MTKQEFNKKQLENMTKLLEGPEPKTQIERDIWNLKYMRYSIKHGSFLYRRGCIKTLDRAIETLSSSVDESETNSYGDPGYYDVGWE